MNKRLLVGLWSAVLVVAACGSSTGTPAPSSSGGGGSTNLAGKTITVSGAFVDTEAVAFAAAVKPFEDATGAKVTYNGDKTFEQAIVVQAAAGNTPDVGLMPQPGLMKTFAADGKLFPLPADVIASIDANYGPGWKDVGTAADGKVYGVFHRVNLKGLVFYPKAVWDAKGYTAPTTWDGMITLMDKMAADGTPPWCIGIESGAGTGWPFTDWVEEVMLRTGGAEGYDAWVTGKTPFTDPGVKAAFQKVLDVWTNPKYVYGGPNYIVQTAFGEAPKAAFDNPPKCLLTNQGNFITDFFPDAVKADLDNQVGVFNLPAIDPAVGTPAEVGGDQAVAFADRPEVWAFLKYLTTPEAGVSWQKSGGALFPYKTQDISLYASALSKTWAQAIVDAAFVRFDGSDAMPSAVGNGTFWKEPIKVLTGSENLDTALSNIQASWPK
ncbi:MAG TPA: ABC transporter substrate-binding protein [Candidatus Limnocylindrales bacterium]